MSDQIITAASLQNDLTDLGVSGGDGLFVHASMHAIGPTVGGARAVIQAIISAISTDGLLAMPGFSKDAYFPSHLEQTDLSEQSIAQVEYAVPGFDTATSPTSGMGVIAETFRTWPGTIRSHHPTSSICLNGPDAADFSTPHSQEWATGPKTPLGQLCKREQMKILLIGVGWNRCSALHTAETLAQHKRTKTRRFKSGPGNAPWIGTPDVADDMDRLFPLVGAAFEKTGVVTKGNIAGAPSKLFGYNALVDFATDWINQANRDSGEIQ